MPLYITYLTAVPSGTSIVYFDDFYGKDRAAGRRFAGLLGASARLALRRGSAGAASSTSFALLLLGREAGEVELLLELDAELAGLRPADDAAHRADADDVDRQLGARARPATAHSTSAPIEEMLRSFTSTVCAVDAGDRPAHQPVTRLADAGEAVGLDRDAVGKLARDLRLRSAYRRCSPGPC